MSVFLRRAAVGPLRQLKQSLRAQSTVAALPTEVDVVVIGGGSLGASCAYHLQERGLKTICLEKHQWTSGTTWHTAGMLWRLRPSDVDVELHTYTREMCLGLEKETGIQSWVENGGLFVANNKERLAEYQRLYTLGEYYGIESRMLTPKEILDIYPILNVDDVYGGMYSPTDGTIDPAGIVMAYKKAATTRGAIFIEGCGVDAIETEAYQSIGRQRRRVTAIQAAGQRVQTKFVVNCAGAWANHIASMAGVQIPLRALKHAYIVTEKLEGVHPGLPNMRDHDLSIYFKTQGDSLALGGYEQNPEFWPEVDPNFNFGLFDLDWDTFGQNMEGHIQRCPQIETVGIKSTVCGPESFTPDHKALVGPDVELGGFYYACGLNSMGMMLGGGMGREMANWIIDGSPSLDMFAFDVARYHPDGARDRKWTDDRTHESYAKTYAIVFPHDEALAGRGFRKSALYDTLLAQGCVYQARQGFERPGWFAPELGQAAECKPYDYYGAYEEKVSGLETVVPAPHTEHKYHRLIDGECTFGWGENVPLVAEEVRAAREGVAIFDQSYFGKFFIEGRGAAQALDWIATQRMDASRSIGSVAYTALCNEAGCVEADLTITKLAEDKFYVAAGGSTFTHDWRWLSTKLEQSGHEVTIRDASDDHTMISVQGPYSRQLLGGLLDIPIATDDDLPFSQCRIGRLAGHEIMVLRLTFIGELGYELHVPAGSAVAVYEAIMAASKKLSSQGVPVRNAGYRAIDSMSAEKNYRHWHADLTTADTPFEAGIGFVALAKLKTDTPFIGRAALEKQRAEGLTRKLTCLILDENHPETPLHGQETMWRNGECVGFIRSAAFGFTMGKQIAYGYVDAPGGKPLKPKAFNEWLAAGSWEIGDRCGRRPASRCASTPFDPKNLRVKGEYPPAIFQPGAC
eukprot:TRINITY_DN6060_c0_g1_i1.p1 TRINITY_DN6060_c0_g1~~TRINITY_DN6060_c0_g1_i1.p1  ORF type:complete len:912 (-),score=120.25 TRINITY_DN6060_c0_g1_i1:181-2916(-)